MTREQDIEQNGIPTDEYVQQLIEDEDYAEWNSALSDSQYGGQQADQEHRRQERFQCRSLADVI